MWMGSWGKHMKAESFKSVREYQKVSKEQFTEVASV